MSLVLQQVEEFLWSDKRKTKCVRSKLSLVNESSEGILINGLYVRNNISNYQEINSFENFAFHFGDPIDIFKASTLSGISNLSFSNDLIDYPNYYLYEPGNTLSFKNSFVDTINNFRFKYGFTLNANSTFNFDIQFSPKEYNIDFYSAKLFLKYMVDGVSFTKSWPLTASLIPNISEIDHTAFPDEVFSIQGMNPYKILTGS